MFFLFEIGFCLGASLNILGCQALLGFSNEDMGVAKIEQFRPMGR
jgi:hypothetical protein